MKHVEGIENNNIEQVVAEGRSQVKEEEREQKCKALEEERENYGVFSRQRFARNYRLYEDVKESL